MFYLFKIGSFKYSNHNLSIISIIIVILKSRISNS